MPVFLLQFPECWTPTIPDSQKDILKRLFSNIFQDIANKFTQSTHHIKHVQNNYRAESYTFYKYHLHLEFPCPENYILIYIKQLEMRSHYFPECIF